MKAKKKKKKAGKEIFLLYFCFSFLFYSSAWISHGQNPIESQRVRAWVMLSNWHPYQGRIGDRMNWGSEKQPPRWLPTITTFWYSFPCVSSPWIKAGHCHTLLMNRMWQVLKSHFHDMIPSWLPSWASILGIFPCPLTSSFYGKPAALLRVHMGKKKKKKSPVQQGIEALSPTTLRNWSPPIAMWMTLEVDLYQTSLWIGFSPLREPD